MPRNSSTRTRGSAISAREKIGQWAPALWFLQETQAVIQFRDMFYIRKLHTLDVDATYHFRFGVFYRVRSMSLRYLKALLEKSTVPLLVSEG